MTGHAQPPGPRIAVARASDCERCGRPLRPLLLALWLLNIADLLLTNDALSRGAASEANRVMGFFLAAGPVEAALFKLGVVTAGVACLWLLRGYKVTLVVTTLLTGFYALVVLYEVAYLSRLVS